MLDHGPYRWKGHRSVDDVANLERLGEVVAAYFWRPSYQINHRSVKRRHWYTAQVVYQHLSFYSFTSSCRGGRHSQSYSFFLPVPVELKQLLLVCVLVYLLCVEAAHFLNHNGVSFLVHPMKSERIVLLNFFYPRELRREQNWVHVVLFSPPEIIAYHQLDVWQNEISGSAEAKQVVVVPISQRVEVSWEQPLPNFDQYLFLALA